MSHRTNSNSTDFVCEPMKKTPSPRRQTTRSTSQLTKEISTLTSNSSNATNEQCIQVIKPVAVRPPSTDANQNPYNLRSRSKLKSTSNSNTTTTTTTTTTTNPTATTTTTEVIPSFTEKLSLETPLNSTKPVPPLTRAAAAASAAMKIGSTLLDESILQKNHQSKGTPQRSNNSRKRKASEDDHRPYLDLLKMKQTQSTYSFDGNSPKKMTRRADQDCLPVDDDDSGCDDDSPGHSPVDFTDLPPGHVYHYEESNMSYDSGFSTGSSEMKQASRSSPSHSTGILTRSSSQNKYPAAADLDVNAIEDDLAF